MIFLKVYGITAKIRLQFIYTTLQRYLLVQFCVLFIMIKNELLSVVRIRYIMNKLQYNNIDQNSFSMSTIWKRLCHPMYSIADYTERKTKHGNILK